MKFGTRRINNNISRKIGDDLSRFTRITIIRRLIVDIKIVLYVILKLYYIVDQVQKLKLFKNNAEVQILITIRFTPYDLCPVI